MSKRPGLAILTLAAVIAVPTFAAAQTTAAPMSFGIKAGLNISTLSVEDDSGLETGSLLGAIAGVSIGRNITENFGINLEGLFSQRGAKDTTNGSDVKLRTTYLDIPLLARWGPTTTDATHFHVFTGPQLGIKLNAEATDDSSDISQDLDDEVKSTDFGWTLGVGVERNQWSLDARYTLGLSNINASSTDGENKNRTFSILAGYRFR